LRFIFFFFKRGGDWFGEKHVRNQKSEIKHQVLPLPLAWAFCPKKKEAGGLWWCGGFGALRTNKI